MQWFITQTFTRVRLMTIFVLFTVLAVIGLSPQAGAQTKDTKDPVSKSALGVSPAIMEQAVAPGMPTTFTLQVNNVTNFPLPIKSYVRDLRLQGESLNEPDRARLDASRWFTIEEPDFILQPNQIRTIKGTIHAPLDAAPGGHYATVFFQPLVPEEALSPSMAYVNTKVGVLAFLVVRGDINEEAKLDKPLHANPLIRRAPITFTFSVRNSGNVHLMPTGKIEMYDWRGRPAGVLDVPPGIILPNTTKEYTVSWQPRSKIGKYRAELTMGYGAERVQFRKTATTVWLVPWIEIILPILFLTLSAVLVYKTRRRWHRAWLALKAKD
jgi:hypothetical protein